MLFFFERLWPHRWFRALLILMLPAVLVSLAVGYVDWSGARRLKAVKEMIAREGESLDMHAAVADAVPDAQNFFAIPALDGLAFYPMSPTDKSEIGLKRNRLANAGLHPDPLKASQGTQPLAPPFSMGASRGIPIDLKVWADWLHKTGNPAAPPETSQPARQILGMLARNDAIIRELAHGLNRPLSQWTPAWKMRVLPDDPFTIAVPNYTVTQALVPMLCLRSTAAARAGDPGAAHQSLLIAARLNQAYMREPILIGILVACGQSAEINGAVWELCDAHVGTADQFRMLQDALARQDYRQGFLCAERGEMAGAASTVSYLNRTRDWGLLSVIDTPGPGEAHGVTGSVMTHLIPSGLFDENEAAIAEWHFNYLLKPLRDGGLTQMLAKGKELDSIVQRNEKEPLRHLDSALAQLWVDTFVHVIFKVIYIQAVENQAIAACALERYRIEHGKYPDTLAAAEHPGEKPIPHDIISGKPMGYRKTPDGRYLLWCVGFSGLDHGGTRMLDPTQPVYTRFYSETYKGDWVWGY
jgi:hypothetical protein